MKTTINEETVNYPVIVVDNPMKWADHNPIFDLNVTWHSLKNYPIGRMSDPSGCLMLYLTPPNDVENSLRLTSLWGFNFRTQVIVRREDGSLQVGLLCNKNNLPSLPDFGRSPLDPVPIRTVYSALGKWAKELQPDSNRKVGITLFSKVNVQGFDWWEPDNIHSIFDLWSYPFRPKNFLIADEIVRIAAKVRDLLILQNSIPWQIGQELELAEMQNIPLSHLEKAIDMKELAPTYRWLWEILQVAKMFPEPVVDPTINWSAYRNQYLEAKKEAKQGGGHDPKC